MAILKRLPPLLSGPVGNNLENDTNDIRNMKHAFAADGRYNAPVSHGYIDRELDHAIRGFQKDYRLKVDGVMKPGGETEATLVGRFLGLEKPKADEKPVEGVRMASAAPAIAVPLATLLGMSATAAMEWWQKQGKEKRESAAAQIPSIDDNDCDISYEEDTNICNDVTKYKGSQRGALCHASASERYASCLIGTPESQRPILRR